MTASLVAGKDEVPEPRRRAALTAMTENLQLVVIDTETTGLRPTDRIVEVALVDLPGGTIGNIWSSLVRPGDAPVRATRIHGITDDHLAGAPLFDDVEPSVTAALTARGDRRVVLVGHRAAFDAARLAYEYRLAGRALPPVLLLDTITLANATGVVSGTAKLDDLLGALGLANSSPHRAAGDALATAQAAAKMLDTLARHGVESLEPLLAAPPKAHTDRGEKNAEMPPAHQVFHTINLGAGKAEREEALNGCLSFGCLQLPDRAEDTITGTEAARAVFVWARDHLREDEQLTRAQAGLLCEAMFRALRAPFQTGTVTGLHLSTRPVLDKWGVCDLSADDLCDTCEEGRRTCRFVRVRHGFALSFLRPTDGHIPDSRADAFLKVRPPARSGKKAAAAPVTSWFNHLLAVGDTSTAAFGVVVLATARRRVADGAWALAYTGTAWDAGLRTPALAYLHSRLVEATAGRDAAGTRPDAFAVCDEVVKVGDTPDRTDWEHLLERHKHLHDLLLAPPRKTPARPGNPRRPAANPYAVAG